MEKGVSLEGVITACMQRMCVASKDTRIHKCMYVCVCMCDVPYQATRRNDRRVRG